MKYHCGNPVSGGDCQILLNYVLSWQPLGSARVFIGSSDVPVLELDGFAQNWHDAKQEMTVSWWTSSNEPALVVGQGDGEIRVECTGTSAASPDITGFYPRTLFKLKGIAIVSRAESNANDSER